MAKELDITLHSDYPPEVCTAKLAEQIDLPQRTVFSFSGYRGKKPILGRVSGFEFCLQKRRYWRNDFGPVLYGRFAPEGSGSRIEAYWSIEATARFFMRFWLGLVALIGTPIFFISVKCAANPACTGKGDNWVGLLVPPAMILWGVLLPRLGAALSYHERKKIHEFLEQSLLAGQVPLQEQQRNWKSSFDRLWVW